MKFTNASSFLAERAWGALDIADIDGVTVRLHWANEPYVWHVNDGPEVFVVLDGEVDMHYRIEGEEHIERLAPGGICYAAVGDSHVAHPAPEARILVIERRGSP